MSTVRGWLLLAWSKRPLGPSGLIGKAVVVCALILACPSVADMPPLPSHGVPAARQPAGTVFHGLHRANEHLESGDRRKLLAQIDLLLRDIDRLLVALQGGSESRNVRAPSRGDEEIVIFDDASGAVFHNRVWRIRPADAPPDDAVPATWRFLEGVDPIVPVSARTAGDAELLADGWLSGRAPLLQSLSLRAGARGHAENRIRGRTNLSRRRLASQRRAGGNAIGDRYYLDWPWAIRPGHNMFFWIVGPPTSIICISVALGAAGNSRRG